MRNWIDEVGRELRYVEVQIGFFQAYVDSRIHRARHGPAP